MKLTGKKFVCTWEMGSSLHALIKWCASITLDSDEDSLCSSTEGEEELSSAETSEVFTNTNRETPSWLPVKSWKLFSLFASSPLLLSVKGCKGVWGQPRSATCMWSSKYSAPRGRARCTHSRNLYQETPSVCSSQAFHHVKLCFSLWFLVIFLCFYFRVSKF